MENHFVQLLAKTEKMSSLLQTEEKQTKQLILGLAGSARALVMSTLFQEKKRPILIVANNLFHATALIEDLTGFVPSDQLHLFPVEEVLAAEMAVASPEYRAERVAAMDFLLSETPGILVVPLAGLRKLLPHKKDWQAHRLIVEQGKELPVAELANCLIDMGYTREKNGRDAR